MGVLWPYGPVVQTITDSDIHVIEFKVPRRGIITAISVKEIEYQHDGTLELFDSVHAVSQWLDPGDRRLITPRKPPGSGNGDAVSGAITITDGAYDIKNVRMPYMNRDGTNSDPVRRLWGKMQMASINTDAQFVISMMIEQISYT